MNHYEKNYENGLGAGILVSSIPTTILGLELFNWIVVGFSLFLTAIGLILYFHRETEK